MQELKDRLLSEGRAINKDMLKVDSFLNAQVDPVLMQHIGEHIAERYKDKGITKVVTIESSGIAPAFTTASVLGVPMIIIKKRANKAIAGKLLQTEITSFTTGNVYEITVSPKYVTKDDHVLIVDDFLANGEAMIGAIRLMRLAHATIAGAAVLIEKSFQPGHKKVQETGIDVYPLVRILSMEKDHIEIE